MPAARHAKSPRHPGKGADDPIASPATPPRLDTRAFRRELTPTWLSVAAVLAGQQPLDNHVDRILWLGCSAALTPAVTATVHPRTQVVAWDPDPSRAAALAELAHRAELTNLEVHHHPAPPPTDDGGSFDLVVIDHLVDTVDHRRRQEILDTSVAAARPGTLICVTYRTTVGWSELTPVLRLIRRIATRSSRDPLHASTSDALALVAELHERNIGYLGPSRPLVRDWVQELMATPVTDVVDHFVHRSVHPLSHAQLVEAYAHDGVAYVGPAHLDAALAHHGLPAETERKLSATIATGASLVLREALTDIAVRRSERADIFRLGSLPMPARDRTRWLSRMPLMQYDAAGASGLGPWAPGSPPATIDAEVSSTARPGPKQPGPNRAATPDEDETAVPTVRAGDLWAGLTPTQRELTIRWSLGAGMMHPTSTPPAPTTESGERGASDSPTSAANPSRADRLNDAIAQLYPPTQRWQVVPRSGTALPPGGATSTPKPKATPAKRPSRASDASTAGRATDVTAATGATQRSAARAKRSTR